MATIKDYLDYAELAQASYGDYQNTTLYAELIKSKDDGGEVNFTQTQAENFANRYEVKAVANPLLTGLDAVLFYDRDNNKYILSIRGTTPSLDVFSDILLAKYGVAYDQLAALNSFYNQWLLDGIIPIGTKLDVTGHSLGGVLAQTFAIFHPNEVANVYSYNAPGIGGLSTEAYEALGLTSGNIANVNITNIYAKEGIEVTSGLGTMIGGVVPISIDNVDPLSNHRIPFTTQSLHIYNMLSSIANTQDISLLTSILEHVTNEKVLNIISDIFKDPVSGSTVDKAITLSDKWSGDAAGITSLVDKTPSQLQSKRVENLYALIHLNPFILEGDYLPAYTDIDPTNYSDKYLEDRAQYLYYFLDKANRYDVDPTLSMNHYEDSGLGSNFTLQQSFSRTRILFGGEGYSTLNGGEYGDHLYGMGGADALNGNGGDDWIEGGEGADIIDGGAGKDVLIGGYTKDKVDAQSDMLKDGTDFDTYISGNTDIINDSDGKGRVYFEGKLLSGGIKDAGQGCGTQPDGSSVYKGDGGVYRLSGNTLTFIKDGKILTFENYIKNQLSLTFTENPADGESCSSSGSTGSVGGEGGSGGSGSGSCPKPVDPSFNVTYALPSPIQTVTYSSGGSTSPIVIDLNRNGFTSINQTQYLYKYKGLAA